MLGAHRAARFFRGRSASAEGLPSRYQVFFTVPYEIRAAHMFERFAQQRPVVGVMVTQERLVQPALLRAAGNVDGFAGARDFAQWIHTAVVHGRGGCHG